MEFVPTARLHRNRRCRSAAVPCLTRAQGASALATTNVFTRARGNRLLPAVARADISRETADGTLGAVCPRTQPERVLPLPLGAVPPIHSAMHDVAEAATGLRRPRGSAAKPFHVVGIPLGCPFVVPANFALYQAIASALRRCSCPGVSPYGAFPRPMINLVRDVVERNVFRRVLGRAQLETRQRDLALRSQCLRLINSVRQSFFEPIAEKAGKGHNKY